MRYEMKPAFRERMEKLLPDKEDFSAFEKIVHTQPKNFIRCNTLKVSPDELMKRLNKKWRVVQPYSEYPEIMLIDQVLAPGELGNSIEHLLGYYYVQEVCSMMSPLALEAKPKEIILDLCASPGSKTSQIAAKMENSGTLIANDLKLDRLKILSANLERNGITNSIVTQRDAVALCANLSKMNFKFDRILVDAPCSGEGTLRSSPKTFLMWNEKVINNFSRQQKKFVAYALKCLKVNGVLVYSTCTHAPEEDEEVMDFAIKNFPVKIETLNLPLKCRPGITEWYGRSYSNEVKKACRIYPHDNDSEGFFVCKMTLLEEIKEQRENKWER
ncbi:MAG: RsmB/NOP family class I SAM-dependent RNA methyltransferase [archaeon]|jgi:NOL1/NOP2/sun family putative RNA methylase|nr:RsmB/NOP family class I SAM-dependent RNA methyltransferase [archaeon]